MSHVLTSIMSFPYRSCEFKKGMNLLHKSSTNNCIQNSNLLLSKVVDNIIINMEFSLGMDTRAYRLSCLKDSHIFEVDLPEVLQMKTTILQAAKESTKDHQHLTKTAKSLVRVAADITGNEWLEKLQTSGFVPEKNTVWVLEGILYYLSHSQAMQVLKIMADKCAITHTVLLADFMNKPSTTLSASIFHFYSDWPDNLLPSLGFSHVKLSQIGDPDAHFGLVDDPLNLFNKLRTLPRSIHTHPDDGTPCCRLYLVQASGFPNQVMP